MTAGSPHTGCNGSAIEYKAFVRKFFDQGAGVILNIVTYYLASWTNNVNADREPTHLTITDGHGAHRIPVNLWD